MFRAIVVDDEVMARMNITDALANTSNWASVAQLESGEGLDRQVELYRPDVVFLDIKMPGQNGLDIARNLLELPSPPLIVFVTAYDEYAVTAFQLHALDYLLKPFDDARFAQCIQRLESILSGELTLRSERHNQAAFLRAEPISRLVIKSPSSLRIVLVENIHWIGACGNYLEIHHTEGKHLLRCPLKQLTASLPADDFCQVHRSYIVRVSTARELKTLSDDKYELELACGESVPVGASFKQNLIERMCY